MKSSIPDVEDLRREIGDSWIPLIYRTKVATTRTRRYVFNIRPRESEPLVLHTLLGIELQIGKMRLACPDEATARYLAVFARLGCAEIALPYDITKISALADELEAAWKNFQEVFTQLTQTLSTQMRSRLRGRLILQMRNEIEETGSGPMQPDFPLTVAK